MNRFLFFVFCLLLMLAPLLFGLVHQLFQALFAVLFLLLVVICALQEAARGQEPLVSVRRILPETVGFGLVLIWMVIQFSGITPEAWHHPLWQEAGAVLGVTTAGAISLAPGAGFAAVMRLLMYAAVFWLALQWGRDRERAHRMLLALMTAAVVYACYGLVVRFADLGMVLWVERPGGAADSLSGTFINRNNFATYLGMAVMIAAGMYLHLLRQALQTGRSGRDRLLHIVQQCMVKAAPQLACLLILLSALFLTGSRAGITATLVALAMLVMLLGPLSRMSGRWQRWLVGSVLLVVATGFFMSGNTWWERLQATDLERETRLVRYQETRFAISQAPVTGYGMGTFEQTFPMYADLRTSNTDKAHNDWLELLYELGVPAGLLWFAVLISLAGRCLVGVFVRHRDQLFPAVAAAAALLVGLHAVVDFSLQIPAVAITFAALLGIGVAQSSSSRERRG